MHCIDAAYCYSRCRTLRGLRIRLSVFRLHGRVVQKRLNQSRCRLGGPRNHVLYGVEIPHRKGQFLGLSGPMKKHWDWSLSCDRPICSRKYHSIHNEVMTAGLLLPTGPCHMTLSPMKNLPPAMRPFVKIHWPLVMSLTHCESNVHNCALFVTLTL